VGFDVRIITQLDKLIRLNGGKDPTTVAKFQENVDRHRLNTYMSWDKNGELEIK
jgi:hypothetical protein